MTYLCPALEPPLDGYGRNASKHLRCHEHFIPTKFHRHPLSSSVVKADYAFKFIYTNGKKKQCIAKIFITKKISSG